MNKAEIVDLLKQDIFTVTFTKVTGEERTMPCTLKEDLIPVIIKPAVVEIKAPRKENDNVLSVWCTDKQAWRSFRIDSVKSVVRGI